MLSLKMDTLLKIAYIAPKGHINLQKNLFNLTDNIMTKIRTAIFHVKSAPTADLIDSLTMIRGMPASNVPAGHIHLQKAG